MELDQEKKEGGRTCTPGGDDKEPRKPDASDGDSDGGGGGGGDDDDVSGTRQPYNCNFCKRGFPTAQALGGHMNVHRKDRARATGTSSSSSSSASAARAYEAFVSFTGQGGLHPTVGIAAAAAAFSSSSLHGERAPRELSLFGRGDDGDKEGGDVGDQEDSKDGDEEKEYLDLELRLGGGS